MQRSTTHTALALRVRPTGESNREAWFLSAEEGIVRAVVFGGPKSKLRSQVAPFHQGKLWVYHDPVRDSRKVTDFDVACWRPGLRELYERTIAADAVAETVLATHAGGGSWGAALDLVSDFLDCLERSDEKTCRRLLLHFFWQWAEFLGVHPDPGRCGSCACEAGDDTLLWFDPAEGALLCRRCCEGRADSLVPGPGAGARRWLLAVRALRAEDALRFNLDSVSFKQVRLLVLGVLTHALGRRLSLWDFLA